MRRDEEEKRLSPRERTKNNERRQPLRIRGCSPHKGGRIQGTHLKMTMDQSYRPFTAAFVLQTIILAGILIQQGHAEIECYVCSFNPYEVVHIEDSENGENQTAKLEWWQLENDTCSWERFDPTRTRTADCERGCEIVKMTDLDGELEMFYRNCLTRPEVTYEFVKTKNILNEEEVFTCNSRLCNGSSKVTSKTTMIFLVALLLRIKTRP